MRKIYLWYSRIIGYFRHKWNAIIIAMCLRWPEIVLLRQQYVNGIPISVMHRCGIRDRHAELMIASNCSYTQLRTRYFMICSDYASEDHVIQIRHGESEIEIDIAKNTTRYADLIMPIMFDFVQLDIPLLDDIDFSSSE